MGRVFVQICIVFGHDGDLGDLLRALFAILQSNTKVVSGLRQANNVHIDVHRAQSIGPHHDILCFLDPLNVER
jgi:hypothetical protein